MFQTKPDPTSYDDRHYLLVRGEEGLLEGERAKVSLGESIVLGRSRRCGLSLKKSARYLDCDAPARRAIRESLAYRSTSRRHCRLTYLAPDLIEVVNLSPNGTLVDGHRVDRVVLDDARTATHEIRLGRHGDPIRVACGSVEIAKQESA
jgi:hypothetical protein